MKSFDILIVGDFRFPGGTSTAIAHELRALRSTRHSVGLYHLESTYLDNRADWHQEIVAEAAKGGGKFLPRDAKAEAKVLFVHSPWVIPKAAPTGLSAAMRILVAHHPPVNATGQLEYDPRAIERHARKAFGGWFVWAPISPVCRDAFDAAGLPFPRLRTDWTNIVFVDDWGAARTRLIGDRPVIGRHSQPRSVKWPANREALFRVYPNDGDIQVHLMGLAESTKAMIGKFPDNWQIWEPNEIPVREFLSMIDFFVYFHHPDWLEAFGRTVAEAAAAGCVVILPPYLKRTFGDAALYCESSEALDLVFSISADRERFAELSKRGPQIIDRHFGPQGQLERLHRVLAAANGNIQLDEIVDRPSRDVAMTLRSYARIASFHWANSIRAIRSERFLRRRLKKIKRKWLNRS